MATFGDIPYLYKNVAGDTTTTIKSGPGLLKSIALNKLAASTNVIIYDNTAASGTIIATIGLGATLFGPMVMEYYVAFTTGLTIDSAAGWDVTAVYL